MTTSPFLVVKGDDFTAFTHSRIIPQLEVHHPEFQIRELWPTARRWSASAETDAEDCGQTQMSKSQLAPVWPEGLRPPFLLDSGLSRIYYYVWRRQ
jgi:hypothetical protein